MQSIGYTKDVSQAGYVPSLCLAFLIVEIGIVTTTKASKSLCGYVK